MMVQMVFFLDAMLFFFVDIIECYMNEFQLVVP